MQTSHTEAFQKNCYKWFMNLNFKFSSNQHTKENHLNRTIQCPLLISFHKESAIDIWCKVSYLEYDNKKLADPLFEHHLGSPQIMKALAIYLFLTLIVSLGDQRGAPDILDEEGKQLDVNDPHVQVEL